MHQGVHKAFLNCVLGILTIPRNPEGHPVNSPCMPFDEIAESGRMSHASCRQKHGLFCGRANVPERSNSCPFARLLWARLLH
jgi:hypothetical protein